MNDDRQADGQGGSGRRGSEPFIIGISEGVNAGYKALEYVLEGLRESVRLRRGSGGSLASSARQQQQRGGGDRPLDLDHVVGMVGDLLGSASDLAQEVARTVGERTSRAGEHEPHHDRLTIKVPQGAKRSTEFCVHNTSTKILKDVKLSATSLVADGETLADVVDFVPSSIEKIAPGRWVMPEVRVAVPARAKPGTYRALLQGEPGGAWAMLEVVVTRKKAEKAEEAEGADEAEDEFA